MVYEKQTVKCRYSRIQPTFMSSVLQGAVEVTEDRGGGERERQRQRGGGERGREERGGRERLKLQGGRER